LAALGKGSNRTQVRKKKTNWGRNKASNIPKTLKSVELKKLPFCEFLKRTRRDLLVSVGVFGFLFQILGSNREREPSSGNLEKTDLEIMGECRRPSMLVALSRDRRI
jgi:hypothetical protein